MASMHDHELDDKLVEMVKAIYDARYITFACYSIIVYDHCLTFRQEVEYYWVTPVTISHVFFFLVRYLALAEVAISISTFFLGISEPAACIGLFRASFMVAVIILILVQAILTLRVWYLFAGRENIQRLTVFCFLATLVVSLPLIGRSFTEIRLGIVAIPGVNGCIYNPRNDRLWVTYVPALFIHTVLYALLVYRVLSCKNTISRMPVLKRFLKEGGLAYLITVVAVTYTLIGSTMPGVPVVFIPVSYASLVIVASATTTTRLMLNIGSLASELHVNAIWLLNHAELSRLNWRQGNSEGEIVVEFGEDDPFELIPSTPGKISPRETSS